MFFTPLLDVYYSHMFFVIKTSEYKNIPWAAYFEPHSTSFLFLFLFGATQTSKKRMTANERTREMRTISAIGKKIAYVFMLSICATVVNSKQRLARLLPTCHARPSKAPLAHNNDVCVCVLAYFMKLIWGAFLKQVKT